MADKVIIAEYGGLAYFENGNLVPIYDEDNLITTQVLDIGVLSAAFNADTRYIRLRSKGAGFWYKFGSASVSALANTNGSDWLPADGPLDFAVKTHRYLDTAADA